MIPTVPTLPIKNLDLPEEIQGLQSLAYNLRWTWRRQTQRVFAKINPEAWAKNAGPVRILRATKNWQNLLKDQDFITAVQAETQALQHYLDTQNQAWFPQSGLDLSDGVVAYFCAEYSFHTSMNQYAGGLGILAGDHVKEASDLALPFVGVGCFYRRGFFHQIIDWTGRQEAFFPTLDPNDHPLLPVAGPDGDQLTIKLPLPGRELLVRVWLLQVGRTPLLLMDTDHPGNSPQDRVITSQLYTAGREARFYQEFVLGVGGVRVLQALGINSSVYHLNEGHSALLLVERLRALAQSGHTLDQATQTVKANSLITIHTPVPEGNERFDAKLATHVLNPLLESSPLKVKDIVALAETPSAGPGVFDMTAYALRHTSNANGVSLLHGNTADKTWRKAAGYPVVGVTNGVHMPTWLGPEIACLYASQNGNLDQATDLQVDEHQDRPQWPGAFHIPDEELWQAHQKQKASLIEWAQARLFAQHARHGEGPSQLQSFQNCLDPDAFLIGFARRFATYKRANLLFTDVARIKKLLNAKGREVQILFAGKAHHSDRAGQKLIETVYKLTQKPAFKGKVFLLEDYDMETGGKLVQGVDMWLNNPRRPLEASGTSGMKAAANGIPNTSILDGWWDEAHEPGQDPNGWAIGDRDTVEDVIEQDKRDAEALYQILEQDVIPTFFDRDPQGLPRKWIRVMKRAIATSAYSFSTARMIRDYTKDMYSPAAHKTLK